MSTLKDRIAERVRELGLVRGWQSELARQCGITGPSVSDWARGESESLEGKNLLIAAEFFGVSPMWLQTGRGRKSPDARSAPFSAELMSALAEADAKDLVHRPPSIRVLIHSHIVVGPRP